ncbi:hypothetical protein T08_15098 [Trichinella sp. T8]|nr:hypothetical protein T08_15098 [Trichinella sp. T8]
MHLLTGCNADAGKTEFVKNEIKRKFASKCKACYFPFPLCRCDRKQQLCYSRFVASVKRDHECPISAYTCRFYSYTSPMPYNPTQLSESCNFMHYVFTKILRYSYAVLDCASIKANVLHVQKCSDRLPSLSISGASADN